MFVEGEIVLIRAATSSLYTSCWAVERHSQAG